MRNWTTSMEIFWFDEIFLMNLEFSMCIHKCKPFFLVEISVTRLQNGAWGRRGAPYSQLEEPSLSEARARHVKRPGKSKCKQTKTASSSLLVKSPRPGQNSVTWYGCDGTTHQANYFRISRCYIRAKLTWLLKYLLWIPILQFRELIFLID